jgi:methyl-accepting chemotaxis protein
MAENDFEDLPTIQALRTRVVGIALAVSTPATAAMAFFLTQLFGLSEAEWGGLGIATLVSTTAMGVAMGIALKRLDSPLASFLREQVKGSVPAEQVREAFRTTIRYPRALQHLLFASWVGGSLIIGATMTVMGYAGWGLGMRYATLVAVATSCGLLSSTAFLFMVKTELTSLRSALAGAIGDPEERGRLIARVPMASKMRAVVVGSAVASIALVTAVLHVAARDQLDLRVANWQASALSHLAASVDAGPWEPSKLALLAPGVAAYPSNFGPLGQSSAWLSEGARVVVAAEVAEGVEVGGRNLAGQASILNWHRLPDGRVLVASVDRALLPYVFQGLLSELAILITVCMALCFGLSTLLTRDVTRATEALGREAARMASGDLRRGQVLESEDELGDRARSFERMGTSLRETVGRVVEAADRVDGVASQMSGAADGVAAASADQVRRIQQASELMLQINSQVTAVAGSAQALNESVEESSSSILELGAAGDELNDTASALSARVDEVSSSIEEMVRSVKQVGANSEVLNDAAAETSSSMEEMASAMRVVDTTAELTADLSRDVVTSAESGQQKVSETIDGIGAIRDSTDVLEGVISTLTGRAHEVGAILDVIDDVADETNLLALNAAIIAAQAGEHGRAFSVVADEIKELADRVLSSTKEIGGQIRSVQEESANAARAIEAGSRSVAQGVERSAEAGVSLEEITRASRESGTRIGEILTAVREQTKAASHVVELMDRVRDGVGEISAAGAEQNRGNEVVFRSSVAMREVAQQVRRTTDEQARGFGRIRESVEGVREAVEQINESLQEQSSACGQVAQFLEQVYGRTRSNEEAAQRMGDSTADLVRYAQALREDVAKFHT